MTEEKKTDSKLGIHLCGWTSKALDFAHCQPAVLKSIDHNPDMLKSFRQTSPGTLTIGRVVLPGFDGRAGFANPKLSAQTVAGIILANIKGCRYDVLEGTNEPVINSEDDAKRLCDFNIELAMLLNKHDFDFAAYSFAATRPDIKYAPHLAPALELADYLAMHAYGPGPLFHDSYWYLFAYRLFWNALNKDVTDFLKGILLTEFGIARGLLWTKKDLGWKAKEGPEVQPRHYGNDLIEADRQLDAYVKGATIFQTGDISSKWHTFEIEDLFPGLKQHIKNYRCEAEEPKMKELPENQIHALDVSEYGGLIKDSQWKAAYDAGFRLAIVQAWGGGPVPGGKNAYCAEQLAGARKAGMMTAIYLWLPPDTTAQTHLLIQAAKDAAGDEYQHIKFVAMDIEGDEKLHPEAPAARLHNAISNVKDKPVVIYSSAYMWGKVMGKSTALSQYPLWDARYDELPELDTNWVPYGGWIQRAMKQYQGTTSVAGISADLNVVHLGRLRETSSPDPIQEAINLIEDVEAKVSGIKQLAESAEENLKDAKEHLLEA